MLFTPPVGSIVDVYDCSGNIVHSFSCNAEYEFDTNGSYTIEWEDSDGCHTFVGCKVYCRDLFGCDL